MALRVEPAATTLGATISGVRLARATAAELDTIGAALLEHGVLVFPGQGLDAAEQRRFATAFGELELEAELANRDDAGRTISDPNDVALASVVASRNWHTDSSFKETTARLSVLSALVLPRTGGATEWADMRHALDALDPDLRDRLAGLSARHRYDVVEATHPVVSVHPDTGRASLFIGFHAKEIVGLDPDEGAALLAALLDAGCRPPRVFRHDWRVGDVVMWDNRSVLHRAVPWDLDEPRVMRHTRIAGPAPASVGTTGCPSP